MDSNQKSIRETNGERNRVEMKVMVMVFFTNEDRKDQC